MAAVEAARPSFVLSNLLGPSSHAFLRAMRDLGRRDPAFSPARCPVVSCDLTECELPSIGLGIADGQLAAAAYFDSVATPENHALKSRVAARFGAGRRVSSYFATSYATVRLCVEAVAASGDADPARVRAALVDHPDSTSVLGPLRIDPATHHAALPFYLGRIAGDGFDILQSRPSTAADPYLTTRRSPASPLVAAPRLRLVS